jgi:hypothetical protein
VTPADHLDLFLPQRREWMHRAMFSGLPAVPTTGDRGPVLEAVADIVDAAAGLEYSRIQLHRAIAVAQDEFDAALSANMSETVTRWEFRVEGEAGSESDERIGAGPRWAGDRGRGEGNAAAVH